MQIEHFIITRFSYRDKGSFDNIDGPNWRKNVDPLADDNLEFRFKLFEMTCLPSILSQTCQNFGWIIIVDKDLQTRFRQKLQDLVKDKKRVYIHVYDPGEKLEQLVWMTEYLTSEPDYILTTVHDDDDALPKRFVYSIQSHIIENAQKKKLPPLKIIGFEHIVQWDLLTSSRAPLGWKCEWHKRTRMSSCGFSLLCRYPDYNFSVLGLRHGKAETYFDFSNQYEYTNVKLFRKHFLEATQRNNEDISHWGNDDYHFDLSRSLGPVLMTNHFRNDQAKRLYQKKPNCHSVTGPESFPGIAINWDCIYSNAKIFRER